MQQWKKEYVEGLAEGIRKYRMQTPALLMLETHRPLLRLGGHFLNVAEPVAAGLAGLERVRRFREILFDAEAVEHLVRLLEQAGDEEEKNESASAG